MLASMVYGDGILDDSESEDTKSDGSLYDPANDSSEDLSGHQPTPKRRRYNLRTTSSPGQASPQNAVRVTRSRTARLAHQAMPPVRHTTIRRARVSATPQVLTPRPRTSSERMLTEQRVRPTVSVTRRDSRSVSHRNESHPTDPGPRTAQEQRHIPRAVAIHRRTSPVPSPPPSPPTPDVRTREFAREATNATLLQPLPLRPTTNPTHANTMQRLRTITVSDPMRIHPRFLQISDVRRNLMDPRHYLVMSQQLGGSTAAPRRQSAPAAMNTRLFSPYVIPNRPNHPPHPPAGRGRPQANPTPQQMAPAPTPQVSTPPAPVVATSLSHLPPNLTEAPQTDVVDLTQENDPLEDRNQALARGVRQGRPSPMPRSTCGETEKRGPVVKSPYVASEVTPALNEQVIERLKKQLLCPICRGCIDIIVNTSCGHLYCEKCIEQARRYSNLCPVCKDEIRHVTKIFF